MIHLKQKYYSTNVVQLKYKIYYKNERKKEKKKKN